MYNLKLLVAIIMIDLTIQQLDKEFYCNKDEVDFNKIDRLIINNDTIYLFLKDKAINFKVPYIYNRNGVLYLVKSQPFIMSIKENKTDHKIIGLITNKTGSTIETYEVESSNTTTFKAYVLDFKNKPGKRTMMIRNFTEGYRLFDPQTSDYSFIYLTQKTGYEFRYFGDQFNFNMIEDEKLLEISSISQHQTKLAVYYEYEYDKRAYSNSSLIEIDYDNNIHIKHFEFKSKDNKQDYVVLKHKFKIDHFFDCHSDLVRDKSSVKGIFSYKGSLFMLINHNYYLLKSEDLFDKNLEKKFLESDNSNHLDFHKYSKEIRFEELKSKWIKVVGNETYLVILDQVFNLTVDDDHHIFLSKLDHQLNKCLIKCLDQTLKVERKLFCFTTNTYFYLCDLDTYKMDNKSKHFKIEEAFDKEYQYGKYQSLQSIFIFNQNKAVFKTKTNTFIVDSRLIVLKLDYSLSIKFDSFSFQQSRKSSSDKDANETDYLLIIFVIIPNVVLLIILICWLCKKRKKIATYFKLDVFSKLNKLSELSNNLTKTLKKLKKKKNLKQKSEKPKKAKKTKLAKKSRSLKKRSKMSKPSKGSKVSKTTTSKANASQTTASKTITSKANASKTNSSKANEWIPNINILANNTPTTIPGLPVYIPQNEQQVEFSDVLQGTKSASLVSAKQNTKTQGNDKSKGLMLIDKKETNSSSSTSKVQNKQVPDSTGSFL